MKCLDPRFVVLGLCLVLGLNYPANGQNTLIISEFMAVNDDSLQDEDGDEEDWIEIHNEGGSIADLGGWYLTDDANDLTKWQFPDLTLAGNGYLIVFASGKDRNGVLGELHTNFKLASDGEYLGLVQPDGATVAFEYSATYPVQAPNVSYGASGNSAETTLLTQGAPARAFIPFDNSLEPEIPAQGVVRPWTDDTLNDAAWQTGTTGVGYDYGALVGLNVSAMQNSNQTVYIRVPFEVIDPSLIIGLTLRMRYDDGMLAYINGREVAWDNSPDPSAATWNSAAPNNRADATAQVPADFNIGSVIDFLHVGTNLLAIQGLNNGIASSDLLIIPEIVATVTAGGGASHRYFPIPTPGEVNNSGTLALGPIIDEKKPQPEMPAANQDLFVTARVTPTAGSLTTVQLRYRVMYGSEVAVTMADNGANADGAAGDGIYGGRIPSSAYGNGQMVRWYITASDNQGRSARFPIFSDPSNSPEYSGTVVSNPSLVNPLPVLHWFIQNPSAAEGGSRASFYYEGEFYDNVFMDIHGQSSRGFPKKSYDVDFHPGHNFKWKAGEPRADDINLLTTYPDKAQMRNALGYETFRDAGSPSHFVIPVRVEQNAAFWGTAHIVENGDEDWLIRLGVNKEGALYKMYNTFTSSGHATSGAEKKTRKFENNADLTALQAGVSLSGAARIQYVYDNFNIPQIVTYLAAQTMTGNTDCCHKNYYFYRDTGVTDEWQMWPWDIDLSFGRVWNSSDSYWDQDLHADTRLMIGSNNGVPQAIFNTPEFRQMYLRRLRTLMDELLKPTGTPAGQLHYEPRIDELAALIAPDAALDAAKWGSHAWGNGSTGGCCPQSLQQAVDELKNSYFPARRNALYNGGASGAGEIPGAQAPGTVINFGEIEPNPASGDQDEEYIQLINPNNVAVDISGWTLSGAVDYEFVGGTVIPAGANVYVSPNRKAFRARGISPRGGESLFVVGAYTSRLSARGEPLALSDRQGVTVATVNTPPVPSLAQSFLRITEMMYHPPIQPGDTFDREEYEYVELKNLGLGPLSLTGIHFNEGIFFNFTTGMVSTLIAGDQVLVVKNSAAFAERYGTGFNIAGVYLGSLQNSSDRIRLEDSGNEKILDFDYKASWYPVTDGLGFSLVIVDETAPFNTWDQKESWRASGMALGSPDSPNAPPTTVAGILVNEVLTHTDLPQKDTVELYNPTAGDVDIGGWFLTDDLNVPTNYQIPSATMILAGSYITFDEDQFNSTPGVFPSFGLGSTGDEIYLFSATVAGQLTGYFHGYSFGAAENGVSFGRYIDSLGEDQFVPMASLTLNGLNSAPKVGPVVINEIHYHPLTGEDEFLELYNATGARVDLYDVSNPTNGWKLEGAGFEFDQTDFIQPFGYLLLVPTDPNDFRTRYFVPGSIPIVGPYSGSLQDSGERLELTRPDTPNLDGSVPYITVDEVRYNDRAPWPTGADGFGPALQRRDALGFGNDPTNWFVNGISPGATNGFNAPPTVQITAPSSGSVLVPPVDPLIIASASDPDGVIRQVEFFADGISLGIDDTAPFSFVWNNPAPGLHQLTARATDNGFAAAVSPAVQIEVFTPIPTTLVSRGSRWNYHDQGADLGTAWRDPGFNDGAWANGLAQLGYGDGDEATVVGFGPNSSSKYITTYFRHAFVVQDASLILSLSLEVLRDDGVVVYLNGSEVYRNNVAPGGFNYLTLASGTATGAEETTIFHTATLDPALLVSGANIVAAEIHQAAGTSSDLSFDLALDGTTGPNEPGISITSPPHGTLYSQPANVPITAVAVAPTGQSINLVEFFQNGIKIGEDASSPYSFNWNGVGIGNYSLTAIAHNSGGTTSASDPVDISVALNSAPTVRILSPGNDAAINNPANITVTADAFDADGSIIRVRFLLDGVSVASDSTAPYTYTWPSPATGTYTLQAMAFDNSNVTTLSERVRVFITDFVTTSVSLIPTNSVWKYLDNGSDQGTSWRGIGFNDTSWASGAGELGYGDSTEGRPETTVLSFGGNSGAKHTTYYFRHSFNLTNASAFSSLDLEIMRDDGVLAYLNDTPIFTNYMPAGPITFTTFANGTSAGVDEYTFLNATAPGSLLVDGQNVLAVEIHQVNAGSSDISFDAGLAGEINPDDIDLDGLPNLWELIHGLDPRNPADAGLDNDGDGLTNGEEFELGTDPNDSASLLAIEIERQGNMVLLQFNAQAGVNYSLESAALVTGGWGELVDLPAEVTNRTITITRPATGLQRFFRLLAQPE